MLRKQCTQVGLDLTCSPFDLRNCGWLRRRAGAAAATQQLVQAQLRDLHLLCSRDEKLLVWVVLNPAHQHVEIIMNTERTCKLLFPQCKHAAHTAAWHNVQIPSDLA